MKVLYIKKAKNKKLLKTNVKSNETFVNHAKTFASVTLSVTKTAWVVIPKQRWVECGLENSNQLS